MDGYLAGGTGLSNPFEYHFYEKIQKRIPNGLIYQCLARIGKQKDLFGELSKSPFGQFVGEERGAKRGR